MELEEQREEEETIEGAEETAGIEPQLVYEQPIIPFSPPPAPVETEEKGDDLSDLFTVEREDTSDLVTVTEEDVMGDDDADMDDDVLALPGEEDLSDLFEVNEEEIIGGIPEPKRVKPIRRFKRTPRRYPPAPRTMGGLRY